MFLPTSSKIYISRHVLFDESVFPYSDVYSSFLPNPTSPLLSSWRLTSVQQQNNDQAEADESFTYQEEEFPPLQRLKPVIPQAVPEPTSPVIDNASSDHSESGSDDDQDHAEAVVPAPIEQPAHGMTTRARSGIIKPNPKYAMFTDKSDIAEPKSLHAAKAP